MRIKTQLLTVMFTIRVQNGLLFRSLLISNYLNINA